MAFVFTTKRMQAGDAVKSPKGETLYKMPLLYLRNHAAFMFVANDHPIGCLVFEQGERPILIYTTVDGSVERETIVADTFDAVLRIGSTRMQDIIIKNSQQARREHELLNARPANTLPA